MLTGGPETQPVDLWAEAVSRKRHRVGTWGHSQEASALGPWCD